jgi:uncharacterized membrane protein (DUF4010 family)
MNSSDIFVKILLSLLFGAILGLESETRGIEEKGEMKALKEEKNKIGGFRTYSLISLLGGISGLFFSLGQQTYSVLLFGTIALFLLIAYTMNIRLKEAFGLTTEIAIIMTFLLGFLTTSSLVNIEVVLVILVLLAFFLSQKRGFGKLIKKIQHKEITDVFRFGLISVVILPLLPNTEFFLSDIVRLLNAPGLDPNIYKEISIINPFQIWMIVVIISGINLGGHVASRIFGEKLGLLFTSIISGFISSTSALISFAEKTKKGEHISTFAGASLISTATSFIFVGFLILISNQSLLNEALVPLIVMFLFSLIVGLVLFFKREKNSRASLEVTYQSFSLVPAIKFVSIIVVLRVVVQILQAINAGKILIVFITALSGVSGIDAPAIAIATLTKGEVITLNEGVLAFLLTVFVNLLAKGLYAYTISGKKFFKFVTPFFLLTGIVGFIAWIIL